MGAYDDCDFSNAIELASTSYGGGVDDDNLYEVALTEVGTYYFACEVSVHCNYGQKITVTVSEPEPASECENKKSGKYCKKKKKKCGSSKIFKKCKKSCGCGVSPPPCLDKKSSNYCSKKMNKCK